MIDPSRGVERMMAILIEHTAGRWPLWLSPRQLVLLPVGEAHDEYAAEALQELKGAGRWQR